MSKHFSVETRNSFFSVPIIAERARIAVLQIQLERATQKKLNTPASEEIGARVAELREKLIAQARANETAEMSRMMIARQAQEIVEKTAQLGGKAAAKVPILVFDGTARVFHGFGEFLGNLGMAVVARIMSRFS